MIWIHWSNLNTGENNNFCMLFSMHSNDVCIWKNTNFSFRLNTGKRNGATASFFTQAKPGTKYETIYQTKMDQSSFNLVEVSLNKTITESNQAYFGRLDEMSAHHECEVND